MPEIIYLIEKAYSKATKYSDASFWAIIGQRGRTPFLCSYMCTYGGFLSHMLHNWEKNEHSCSLLCTHSGFKNISCSLKRKMIVLCSLLYFFAGLICCTIKTDMKLMLNNAHLFWLYVTYVVWERIFDAHWHDLHRYLNHNLHY